jgi:hypothetical protein
MSDTDTFTPPILIVLFTSTYLMIRAFDNVKRGLDERQAKTRSILTTIEKLSSHKAAEGFRFMFAVIVRSTGRLFLCLADCVRMKRDLPHRRRLKRTPGIAGFYSLMLTPRICGTNRIRWRTLFRGRTEFPLMSVACTVAQTQERAFNPWMLNKFFSTMVKTASLALGEIPVVPEKVTPHGSWETNFSRVVAIPFVLRYPTRKSSFPGAGLRPGIGNARDHPSSVDTNQIE